MIFNTTLKNKKIERQIDELAGPSYSFLERIKMRGNGSGRMIIEKMSKGIYDSVNGHAGVHFTNMEQRPKGVLMYLERNTTKFTWVIPFHHLAEFRGNSYNIHAQGEFVNLKMNTVFPHNSYFITRMNRLKREYMY